MNRVNDVPSRASILLAAAAAVAAAGRVANFAAEVETVVADEATASHGMPPRPRSCCTSFAWLHRGAFSSAFVAYGIDGEMGDLLESASSRFGVGGHMYLAPSRQLAISYFGADSAVDSLAGSLIFFDVTDGTLQQMSWDATQCLKEPYEGDMTPASCVGDGSFFPTFVESTYHDVLGPWSFKWASPCGYAHLSTNAASCMPTTFSVNATVPVPTKHTPFPLWRGANGRIVINFANSSAIPAPVSAFVPPTRCTATAQ